jgi:hypothetical protein
VRVEGLIAAAYFTAMRRRTFLQVISAGAAGALTGGFYEGRRMNYEVGREIQCVTM